MKRVTPIPVFKYASASLSYFFLLIFIQVEVQNHEWVEGAARPIAGKRSHPDHFHPVPGNRFTTFFCAEEVIPSFPSDKKNGFRNFVLSVMVEMGVHKKGDGLDPDGLKAKLVFGITQLIYTLITISPVGIYSDFSSWFIHILYQFQTLFFFSSYALSCGWMVLAYSWGTWNGACYYIEVLKSTDPKFF